MILMFVRGVHPTRPILRGVGIGSTLSSHQHGGFSKFGKFQGGILKFENFGRGLDM
jgi:hypothetical protein